MSKCTCGKASCALHRSKGGRCPGPHETPRRDTGAATPTSSKFAALRRKIAVSLKLEPPGAALTSLPKGPSLFTGHTAATRATAPSSKDDPTAPKLSSYDYTRAKIAFNLRGMAGTAGKWLGRGSKLLGVAPTGFGNIASGVLGAVGGAMSAHSQGKGFGGMLAHAGAGALQGIPGGVGIGASMAADAAANAVFKPQPPPPVGSMV